MVDDKALKASLKEGGKKGIDLQGMSDMGGVKYFNVVLESADGNLELISKVLEGLNAVVDEAAEERRGGAGDLGKLLLSSGDKTVAVLCNIPANLKSGETPSPISAKAWTDKVVEAAGGTVVSREETEVDGSDIIKVLIQGDPEKGFFPMKMRDAAQTAGFAFLREKGLLPDQDSDDDYIPDPEAAGIEW